MNPVMQYSVGNVLLIPGTCFSTRRNNSLTILSLSRSSVKHGSSTLRFLLPPFIASGLISQNNRRFSFHKKSKSLISATETEVALEEPDSPVADEVSAEASETPSDGAGTSKGSSLKSDASPAPAKASRSRSARRSEMPPIKNEDLIPGATFTGKVKSIQPFGAFIDFGAFTDGLVHVSNLSDSYVKDVASVVSVGQEVKVKLIEVNTETQRISLSMRESDDTGKPKQRKDVSTSMEKAEPGKRNTPKSSPKKDDVKKRTKFVKGQDLEGTVKNIARSGAFISLPDGEEGFLPISEEDDEGFGNAMGTSSLEVGQEVSVRVLRITRGSVTLTMKKEKNIAVVDSTIAQGVVHVATNPFVLAFRNNKDVAAFLDEREKIQNAVAKPSMAKTSEEIKGIVKQGETVSDVPDVQGEPESSKELIDEVSSTVQDIAEDEEDARASALDGASTSILDNERDLVSNISSPMSGVDGAAEKEAKVPSGSLAPEGDVPDAQGEPESSKKLIDDIPSIVKNNAEDEISDTQADISASALEGASTTILDNERDPVSNISSSISGVDSAAEKEAKATSGSLAPEGDVPDAQGEPESSKKFIDDVPSTEKNNAEDDISENVADVRSSAIDGASTVIVDNERDPVSNISGPISGVDGTAEKEAKVTSGSLASEGDVPPVNQIIEEATQTDFTTSNVKIDLPLEITNANVIESAADHIVAGDEKQSQTYSAEEKFVTAAPTDSALEVTNENVIESGVDHIVGRDEKQSQTYSSEEEFAAAAPTDSDEAEPSPNKTNNITGSDVTSSASVPKETTDGAEDNDHVILPENNAAEVDPREEVQKQTLATENENSFTSEVEDKDVAVTSEKNSTVSTANGQTGIPASDQGFSKATISPALVKQLREETGAGMMDCKKALSETGGHIIKAQEFLRKKGLASAEKKASRVTAEGRIGSYIHDSRIGVLVEVNCETDFVSRGEIFKELVDDIAMQVAACPQVEYLVTEDVPEEIVNKEKEIEMQKEDLLSKPEQIRSKIVEGRIRKRLEELALLEQPYIKNDKFAVKDWVKQTISTVGENIKVKRFVRFNLGEGLAKKSQDFAAEVAAQTVAKPVPTPNKEQPVAEAKETEQKSSTVTVSAALVKQLREETGAGMMDCKKALAETGGDLEKAQEYLRKKGLSTADKKSSRLAAEGGIGSYIHDSRIGVLIEVNCETDFVGRSEKFKELVDDLAMQVVACPQVQFVSIEDIPEIILIKEKELEMQREDIISKPENIRERIVEGRVSKRLGELALLEQPFIKDDKILVKDLVKQTVAAIGENIKVRRFVRFTLGETATSETTIPA